jgi:peroxiredoxin
MKRSIVLLTLVALAGICGCSLLHHEKEQPTSINDFPEFKAALDGKQVAYGGSVVVAVFWTRYNPYCVSQIIPHMKALYGNYKDLGVQIVGVNTDSEAGRKLLDDFIAANHINYPDLFDDGRIAKEFGVANYPSIFVFDRSGVLAEANYDPENLRGLDARVAELAGAEQK